MNESEEKMHELDKKAAVLESTYRRDFKFLRAQLDKVESNVQAIALTVQTIKDDINIARGADSIRNKMWLVACSSVTVVSTFGAHFVLFKFFGVTL